jgi:hypothetical protein
VVLVFGSAFRHGGKTVIPRRVNIKRTNESGAWPVKLYQLLPGLYRRQKTDDENFRSNRDFACRKSSRKFRGCPFVKKLPAKGFERKYGWSCPIIASLIVILFANSNFLNAKNKMYGRICIDHAA